MNLLILVSQTLKYHEALENERQAQLAMLYAELKVVERNYPSLITTLTYDGDKIELRTRYFSATLSPSKNAKGFWNISVLDQTETVTEQNLPKELLRLMFQGPLPLFVLETK